VGISRNVAVSLGVLGGLSQVEKDPLKLRHLVALTELWKFDKMHRRAGRDAGLRRKVSHHADAHKNCPLGRCGTRPGPYAQNTGWGTNKRSSKITAWRKAKARENRAHLEENVYGREKSPRD